MASPAAAAAPATPVPGNIEFLVHTGPGGGSDLFAREIGAMLTNERLIGGNWTVNNVSGGDSARAQAYLVNQKGRNDIVAAMTITWLSTPLTSSEVKTSYKDFTPISRLLFETSVVAVRADGPYKTFKDFVDAAKAKPDQLNQAGGSATSVDGLTGEVLKKTTGASWNYLSFPGGGERIAALLGGNADIMIGAPAELGEQVRAGTLRLLGVVGDQRLDSFPDVPTLPEQGVSITGAPQAARGILGPSGMSASAVAQFDALFRRLTETAAWKQYIATNNLTPAYQSSAAFQQFLDTENASLDRLMTSLNLKGQ